MRVCVGDKNGEKIPARSRGRGIPQTIIFSIVEDMPRKPLAPHKPVFCATLVANEQNLPLVCGDCARVARNSPLLIFRPSAPAVGQPFGGANRRGSVQLRNDGALSPMSDKSKEFTHYRAWIAAPDGLRGLLGRGQDSPTAGHSRI